MVSSSPFLIFHFSSSPPPPLPLLLPLTPNSPSNSPPPPHSWNSTCSAMFAKGKRCKIQQQCMACFSFHGMFLFFFSSCMAHEYNACSNAHACCLTGMLCGEEEKGGYKAWGKGEGKCMPQACAFYKMQ